MEARARATGLQPHERGEARGRAPAELDVALAADVGAGGVARSLVKLKLGRYLSAEEHAVFELLVTELVNNAVLHGGAVATGKVGLRVDVGHERIRAEVRDAGLGFRRVEPDRPPGEQGGFGLVLVNDLATRWDVDVTDGTCVWFELERANIA
jgi:anti-sigma regulatory factor (Ser/Thr protein kinase)